MRLSKGRVGSAATERRPRVEKVDVPQPGNSVMQVLVAQQVGRHRSDLAGWAHRVEGQSDALEAFRLATQRPAPPSLVASLKALHAGARSQADQAVERALDRHVADLGSGDPRLPSLLRLAQGHWPRVYRSLETIRQRGHKPERDAGPTP